MPKSFKPGLYANINAKKKRIAAGSGEKMRKVGAKGAPSKQDFIDSAKTAKPVKRAAGSPPKGETTYEVLGRRVTKEQYDEASKEMDRPKSKVEEDMDDFAKQARERAKMKPVKRAGGSGPKGEMAEKIGRATPAIPRGLKSGSEKKVRAMSADKVDMSDAEIKYLIQRAKEQAKEAKDFGRITEKELKEMDELVPKMKTGGMAMKSKMADKTGRAMKKTAADAKGRAMPKAKGMMAGGMAKGYAAGGMAKGYAGGGKVAAGKATRGYGAARKGC